MRITLKTQGFERLQRELAALGQGGLRQATADALGRLLETLEAQIQEAGGEMPVRTPWQLQDCGWVANRWCEMLPLGTPLKQRLMELDNPLVRLELVGDLLARNGITQG